jgi:hypothetical protein
MKAIMIYNSFYIEKMQGGELKASWHVRLMHESCKFQASGMGGSKALCTDVPDGAFSG